MHQKLFHAFGAMRINPDVDDLDLLTFANEVLAIQTAMMRLERRADRLMETMPKPRTVTIRRRADFEA